jgi:ABC-type Na+ efflux pump permease subunit
MKRRSKTSICDSWNGTNGTERPVNRIVALLGKELADLRGNPAVFVSAIITGIVSILMPFVIAVAVPYLAGERLSDSSDFRIALEMYRDQPGARSLDPEGAIQAMIFQQFLILLLLTPVAGAMSVAAYAVVGEKQARTLEPLLATPLTTFELLAGKILGALLPGLVLATVCFTLYVGGVALLARPGVYRTLFFPRALLTMFLLGPLASLAALQMAVCVSSRSNDARSAQQVGALIILPISALLVAEFTNNVQLTSRVILLMSLFMAVLNAALMAIGVRLFDRESILTRWK